MESSQKCTMLESCFQRKSYRVYNGKDINPEKLKLIMSFVSSLMKKKDSDKWEDDPENLIIKHLKNDFKSNNIVNCLDYLAIIGPKEASSELLAKSGYLFQLIILYCWTIGIKTCWIGGKWLTDPAAKYFKQNNEMFFNSKKDQVICIVSIGESNEKIKVRPRLSNDYLFFKDKFGNVLDVENELDDKYQKVFSAFRWSPSGCNRQKWRIIKEKNKNVFHFWTNPSSRFYSNIDIGIGLCNWKVACDELKIKGKFEHKKLQPKDYIGEIKGQGVFNWVFELGVSVYEMWNFSSQKNVGKAYYFMSWISEE